MTPTLASLIGPKTFQQGESYVDQTLLDKPPLAPGNLVFLLPAIAQAGRATIDEWGDWEHKAKFFLPVPAFNRTAADIVRTQQFRPPPPMPSLASIAGGQSGAFERDQAAYREAKAQWDAKAGERLEAAEKTLEAEARERQEIERAASDNAAGIQALHDAFSAIARQVVNRKIELHARLCSGGRCFIIPPDTFADEGLAPRVTRQGILTMGTAEAYLFLDREQFERAFSLSRPVAAADLESVHLSDDLQLAIAAIREWDIKPGDGISIPAIAKLVTDIAELKGITLSPRRAKEIARMARGQKGAPAE